MHDMIINSTPVLDYARLKDDLRRNLHFECLHLRERHEMLRMTSDRQPSPPHHTRLEKRGKFSLSTPRRHIGEKNQAYMSTHS
jgi:hypothetical protein